MQHPGTRQTKMTRKALVLVCLIEFLVFHAAQAQPEIEPQGSYPIGTTQEYPLHEIQPSSQIRHTYALGLQTEDTKHWTGMANHDNDPQPRADLYTIVKLALEEFEFLAGIRFLWIRTEKRLDKLAIKLKLKGDISLYDENDLDGNDRLHLDSAHELTPAPRHLRRHRSPRPNFIPKRIRWNIGYDLNDGVAFGELKLGPYLSLQTDVGNHQEVKMVFQYSF
jgi:hypothetical protein